MADLLPGIPNVPGDETTWEAFVNQFEALKKGAMPLSLTHWDNTTTKPEVAAGSLIEVAGAVYLFNADEGITNDSGLIAGTVYVVVRQATASEAKPMLVNTQPIWREDLNGWYEASGTGRYTGHSMEWDGSSGYSFKHIFQMDRLGDISINGNLNIGKNLEVIGEIIGDSINVGNVGVKMKYISTTADGNGLVNVSHGISDALNVVIGHAWIYQNSSDYWYPYPTLTNYHLTSTNAVSTDGYGDAANRPIRILIHYM